MKEEKKEDLLSGYCWKNRKRSGKVAEEESYAQLSFCEKASGITIL